LNKPLLYQLVTYIPETHLSRVKEALFQAGAGRLGNYDRCCWCTPGEGSFRPLEGSNPFLGKPGKEEQVPEIRLECVVTQDVLDSVIQALKEAHPYETPAFSYWRINEGVSR